MKTTLLIPTLNEIDGMQRIMPQINRRWVNQILIIDGGSTDGTVQYARDNGYKVIVQKKKGMRNAYKEALPYCKGDVIITFSPDGNSIPGVIPTLVDKMKEGYDMVIASRYANGAVSYDDDRITGFGNWLFTRLINLIYGAKYTDAMVIYRAYKKSIIETLGLNEDGPYALPEKLFKTNISWEPLMSVRAAKLNVTEIGADEPERVGGVRKLQVLRWGAAYLYQILTDWRRK